MAARIPLCSVAPFGSPPLVRGTLDAQASCGGSESIGVQQEGAGSGSDTEERSCTDPEHARDCADECTPSPSEEEEWELGGEKGERHPVVPASQQRIRVN